MKGVDALLASVLILLISITAIFLALQLGGPATQKTEEILLMQEGESNLISINNAVNSVLTEGGGSVRVLRLSISGGEYKIDNSTNSIQFLMESRTQIIAEGVSKIENGINFTGLDGNIYLNLSYNSIQVTGEGDFGEGYHTLIIRNDGFNETSQKQIIYISLTPVAPSPLVTFKGQYNQTQTLVLKGTNSSSPNNLNDLGINTYNITETVENGGQYTYSQNSTANLTGFNTSSADYTNYLDSQNYNVTSQITQITQTNQYNQTQTSNTTGSASTTNQATINSYLNTNGDGLTWNITESPIGLSTIAFDKASSMTQSTTASSISWSHTTGAGNNRLLLVAIGVHVATGTPATVTNVTYGGVPLTQLTTDLYSATNPQVRTYVFILVNPGSGANTIRVNFSAATLSAAGAVTYAGVDQTNPIQVTNTTTGSGTTASSSITVTGSGRLLFGHLGGHITSAWTITEGTGQTNRWSQITQLYKGRGSDKTVAAGSQSMYWNSSIATNFVVSAIVINPAPTYRGEVEHNTTINYSGILNSINVSVNFTSTLNGLYNLTIYNFANSKWNATPCQGQSVTANNYYTLWCNVTVNPTNYNSSSGIVRIRLNDTTIDVTQGMLKEEYVQYYVTNSSVPYYNVSVEHNSSTIPFDSLAITKISVSTILKTNISSGTNFTLYIYNFSSNSWFQCSQSSINNFYSKMECIISNSPSYYVSNNKITVRLNSSGNTSHNLMEDYLTYQITMPNTYRTEVEHNATGISESGTLNNISISLNFSTNSTDLPTFNLAVYNFISTNWETCDSFNPPSNIWYMRLCNLTANPENYLHNGVIRIRLNETSHQNFAQVKEDYVQYYVTYTQ